MKKEQVKVGNVYRAKVSGAVVPVKITAEKWSGDKHTGWVGTNTETGRSVRVKSAQRLRSEVNGALPPGARVEILDDAPALCLAGATEPDRTPPAPAAAEPVPEAPVAAVAAQAATAANVGQTSGNGAVAKSAKKASPAPKAAKAKKPAAAKPAKPAKAAAKAKPPKADKPKRMSALDAAAQVLAAQGAPMNVKEIFAAITSKGLWKSPVGKTPEASIYAAIIREIAAKGRQSRFKKVDKGQFAATGRGA